MSDSGMKAAIEYGDILRSFKDLSEAEDFFYTYKDIILKNLESICIKNALFTADYSVDSLTKIEKWYFDLYEKKEFSKIGITQETFEKMMGVYYGEVAVRNNAEARWVVREFPFSKGKYELLIKKGLMSMSVIEKCNNLCTSQGNKRKNHLFRDYNKYVNRPS